MSSPSLLTIVSIFGSFTLTVGNAFYYAEILKDLRRGRLPAVNSVDGKFTKGLLIANLILMSVNMVSIIAIMIPDRIGIKN